MTEYKNCPKCGGSLPANAPEGICPACLLSAGLPEASGSELVAAESQQLDQTSAKDRSGFVPPSPQVLAEQFPQLEILRLIGKGGMGAVYEARQRDLDRKVALKVLPPEFEADPTFAERFMREARALAKLSHQNIVSVFDFGKADGQFYFIMEYVDGANLRQLMESGNITPSQALEVVHEICEALQFAHKNGVVHRDIKPENILVDKQGQVKIADFGLAKLHGNGPDISLTGTEQIMGTFRYMAPEQMMGTKNVDHRADIFSLGVIFYELLTGEIPMGRFDPPSMVGHSDARLDEVVLRTLEKEPDRRYQQASEVSVEIQSISKGEKNQIELEKAKQVNKEHYDQKTMAKNDEPYASPYDANSGTMPNYGLLILGGTMITLGIPLLGIGLLLPVNQVFLWIGLGITLGGGANCTSAFVSEARIPAGTPTVFPAVFGGLFMTLIGAGLLVTRIATAKTDVILSPADVIVWIGIGLFIGGGGVCCAGWSGLNREDQ